MTDTKPLKPLPNGLMAKVRQAFAKPEQDTASSQEPPSYDEIVRRVWRDILARYVSGETMEDIGKSLKPLAVPGAEIRRIFAEDAELRHRLAAAKQMLSHHLFERAVRTADKAERSGEYNTAWKAYLTLAATLNKADYGQRVTVGGDPEAPIHHQHEGRVELAPDEAYKALLEGGK